MKKQDILSQYIPNWLVPDWYPPDKYASYTRRTKVKNNFSLYWLPERVRCDSIDMRECAQKLQNGKRICIVGQVPISTNQYVIERKSIMRKDVITVFTAKKARKLLKEGYQIVDIKPDKTDFDGKRTLFLFKYEDGLMESLSSKEN